MAVVQISRIQIRRGQKNIGSGLPQLAGGEMAWAVDTRELFIGNGAVSEGAPAVGNTKILTQYDDILNLADTYTYKKNDSYVVTGPNSSNPVVRTIQERMDDRVSVRSFGASGDGIVDDTVALQRAIDQLYLNSATKGNPQSRVKLHIEAGTYIISDTLYIPPYATLIGAGSEKTVIQQTVNKPALVTVNSSSTPGSPANDSSTSSVNQAREIHIEGLTIETTQAGAVGTNPVSTDASGKGLVLQSCVDSTFKDISFKGVWTAGATDQGDTAVVLNMLSGAVKTDNNTFKKCRFYGYSSAVRSDYDINKNVWEDCEFELLGYGVVFGQNILGLSTPALGQSTGPSHNTVKNSNFYDIKTHAIWVNVGRRNVSESNSFTLVGTDNKVEDDPLYAVIKYETTTAASNFSLYNKSFHDFFARTALLSNGTSFAPYYPEVEGQVSYTLEHDCRKDFTGGGPTKLLRLPGLLNQSFEIDYTMVNKTYDFVRSGVLHVVADRYSNKLELSDDFHFTGDETKLDAVELTGVITLINGVNYTIEISVTSGLDAETEFKYNIKTKNTDI